MTRTATTGASKTVTIKKVKAKHFANQAGLDRLQELLVKATSNPNAGQNYALTIKRAFKSLQECKEPILTQKDAVKLKYIGPAMAKRICPQSTGVEVTTTATSKPNKPKTTARSKSTTTGVTDAYEKNDNNATLIETSVAVAADRLPRNRPPTGLPFVCPRTSIPSASRCASALESTSETATAKESAYSVAKLAADLLVLPPKGPWKVILLVDNREHKSKQVVSSCKQAGIPCEERQLAIGDMAWIARCIVPNENEESLLSASTKRKKTKDDDKFRTIEILVGTIVERKEVSDLASSLFGTRYHEQRLRLSQCGLPQILFLVEGNLTSLSNCPAETLQMAMMETRINLGFQIIQTKHLTDTVSILKTLHARIVQRTFPDAFGKSSTKRYSDGELQLQQPVALPTFGGGNKRRGGRGNRRASSLLELVFDTVPRPPFGRKRFITYPELKAKVEVDRERGTRSVRAITLAMLKQIPTLSQKKCTAIAHHYPTMNRLLTELAYPNNHHTGSTFARKRQHPKKVVQDIEIDTGRRTIGPNSASEIYAACCTLRDGSTVACHEQDTQQAAAVAVSQTKQNPSFLSGARSFDGDDNENRKLPKTTTVETNSARPAVGVTRNEKPPPKKARNEYASAITASNTTNNNSLLQFLDSSPEEPERAFATRKRHFEPERAFATRKRHFATTTTAQRGFDSPETPGLDSNQSSIVDNRKIMDSRSHSKQQHQVQQETVDLLTPETSARPTFAEEIGKMDISDWSNSSSSSNSSNSNDVCDILRKGGTNTTAIAPKALATTTSSTNNNAATRSAVATIGFATNRRGAAATDGEDSLLLTPDEDDSPLSTKIAAKKDALANRDFNACAKGTTSKPESAIRRNYSSIQATTPSTYRFGTNEAGNRLSLESSPGCDRSFLFSSPDENHFSPFHPGQIRNNRTKPQSSTTAAAAETKRSELKPPDVTNRSEKDTRSSEIGIVCLLDDSDDETIEPAREGLAQKDSKTTSSSSRSETSFSAGTTLQTTTDFRRRDAFVTITRGSRRSLPSTQESGACSSDTKSSEGDLDYFGTSLRERLGAIRGRDLREVIELDDDSDSE